MKSETVVDIKDLVFRWPRQSTACLDLPELRLQRGEHAFLHGPSGCGKSTLLSLIGGVLAPGNGRIDLLGQDLGRLRSTQRDRLRADHIGFVFQQFNLVPYLPVIDNVLLPCRFSVRRRERAQTSGSSLRGEAERLLGHLDLARDLWRRPATDLSVGQQQRVAAARALIGHPELLIADEPTSALDAERQEAFLDLLLREANAAGSTVLFVSHDRRLAPHFLRDLALPALNRAASGETA
ncbi:MAG: ABC transporter ATP-binding protein [Candidatus Accumulibacter phosphatis]|uniref:ABC transporter ATP-binding protein n=1 Tax=Candidatus Accumulibacter sp. ACC012 TaxID=2823332 RepID=UPI0025BA2BBA|nr:ABC transporter ATP-binding protein [Candidatus Accumulibacter sp. ACC012]